MLEEYPLAAFNNLVLYYAFHTFLKAWHTECSCIFPSYIHSTYMFILFTSSTVLLLTHFIWLPWHRHVTNTVIHIIRLFMCSCVHVSVDICRRSEWHTVTFVFLLAKSNGFTAGWNDKWWLVSYGYVSYCQLVTNPRFSMIHDFFYAVVWWMHCL